MPLFSSVILYAADLRPKFLENRVLVYLGDTSYGFYIFQFILIQYLLFPMEERLHPLLAAMLGFLITQLLASISYHLLKTPLRRSIKRRMSKSVRA